MSIPEEWIKQIDSNEPLERIIARINLLREFPYHSNQDLKSTLYFDLSRDVPKAPLETLDYVFDLQNINEKAYAIWATDFGFSPYNAETDEEKEVMKQTRKKFLEHVEDFADKLSEVENLDARANVAKLITNDCSLDFALVAVDVIWNIGWDKYTYKSIYSNYDSGYIVDFLESIATSAKELAVRKKALTLIGKIPDRNKINKYIKNIITSKDTEIAILAVDLYIEKNETSSGRTRADVAIDALLAKQTGRGGETISVAKLETVEYAFDRMIKFATKNEAIQRAYNFIREDFNRSERTQGYPPGLFSKTCAFLEENLEEVSEFDNQGKRDKTLFYIAINGNKEMRGKAIDFLAQGSNGILNIAKIYTDFRQFGMYLSQEMRERVKDWALKYVREFVKLEDKELARNALTEIGGGSDSDFYGDGAIYKDEESGRKIDEVAREELKKLPKPPTKQDKLSDVFGLSESKP
jgi:hypothetical protein